MFRLLLDVSSIFSCVFFSVRPAISPKFNSSFSNKTIFFGMFVIFTVYIKDIIRNIINNALFKNFKTGHPIFRVTSFRVNII